MPNCWVKPTLATRQSYLDVGPGPAVDLQQRVAGSIYHIHAPLYNNMQRTSTNTVFAATGVQFVQHFIDHHLMKRYIHHLYYTVLTTLAACCPSAANGAICTNMNKDAGQKSPDKRMIMPMDMDMAGHADGQGYHATPHADGANDQSVLARSADEPRWLGYIMDARRKPDVHAYMIHGKKWMHHDTRQAIFARYNVAGCI
jgi:hypothetical protein